MASENVTPNIPLPGTERIEVLKQELTILAAKIGGTVDTLWKIRGLSLTLWTATFTVGVGNFTNDKRPIIVLLLLTALLPLLFLLVDARNNRWYRCLRGREEQIRQFLNNPNYVLPASNLPATLQSPAPANTSPFPVYDLAGDFSFGKNPEFQWETSALRSMLDSIPTIFYWSQVFFSCIACTIYACPPVRWVFLPIGVAAFLFLRLVAWLKKKQICRDPARRTP